MQTGILPVYLTRNIMLDKGTFSPSVKCCWGAPGLSFHRQMLQINIRERDHPGLHLPDPRILYFKRQRQGSVEKKKQSPGSVWPGKGQGVE